MSYCEFCPLKDTGKRCPSADYKSYCAHMRNEQGQPFGYWRTKLLKEADKPAPRANPCDPDEPLVFKARPNDLEHEVVVAKYKEDVAWINDCPYPVTLYDKCPGSASLDYKPHVVVRHLPNVGREAGTMLTHIVDNYDNISEWTYFVQGSTHSGVELFGRITTPYEDTTALTAEYLHDFPSPEVKALDRVERHGSYEVRYGRADRHGDYGPAENVAWLSSVWGQWFSSPQPDDDWYFAYAAEIAVPRRRILQRPREFYKYALDLVNGSSIEISTWNKSPVNAWAWELIWLYVLGDADKYPLAYPPKGPGLLQMGINFMKSATTQVLAGNPKASEELQEERKAICLTCPLLINNRCAKCGCTGMDLKRSWLTSACPDGKW